MKSISDQLREILLTLDQSRYSLSKEAGIDKEVLRRFMKGDTKPSMETVDAIGKYLGLKITLSKKKAKDSKARDGYPLF